MMVTLGMRKEYILDEMTVHYRAPCTGAIYLNQFILVYFFFFLGGGRKLEIPDKTHTVPKENHKIS